MGIEQQEMNDFFMLRFKNGDEKAFETIFKSDYNKIVGFCNQFVNDRERAKNQAQEAFINLWLNLEKIATFNGIRSFLYTYAKSACLNYIRHEKVVSKYSDKQLQQKENLLNREVLESFDFNSLEFSELEELILRSIDELPEKCRQVFVMSRFDGKTNREIAEELGISVKSVEANMNRALKALKSNFSDYLPLVLIEIIMQYVS